MVCVDDVVHIDLFSEYGKENKGRMIFNTCERKFVLRDGVAR